MANNYYIVAIELSSSKISGAVGIETTEGMRILATASTPVDGFISKGVVRNVDKTSEAITSTIYTANPVLNGHPNPFTKSNSNQPATVGNPGIIPYKITNKMAHEMKNALHIPAHEKSYLRK